MSTSFYKRFQQEEQPINVYLVDADRLDLRQVRQAVERLYPEEHVELHNLIREKVNLVHIDEHLREMRRLLAGLDPERDRLIVAGRSMANFLAGIALQQLGVKRFTLLLWDFMYQEYTEMTVEAGDVLNSA